MWWAILAAAYADTLELDNGAVLEGELAAYDRAGDCHIAVAEGSLAGAVVVVPCSRVVRMERERLAYEQEAPVAEPPPVVEVPLALPAEDPQPIVPIAPVQPEEPVEVAAQAPPPAAPQPAEPTRRTWLDNLEFSDPFRR